MSAKLFTTVFALIALILIPSVIFARNIINDNIFIDGTVEAPIIGLLSQETYSVNKYLEEQYRSYIAASYVKYLESGGARVVPIWTGQDESYYRRVVNYTNGIFFPGGATYFNETKGYGEAANMLYKYAIAKNKQGVYYPVWGTCLGMQVILFAEMNGQKDVRQKDCVLKKVAVPLDFEKDVQKSRMFSQATDNVIQILETENVTYNYHQYCITKKILDKYDLAKDWRIISTNKDNQSMEFISAMEHARYPIYAVQFHPEKSQFEFSRKANIPHTLDAVIVSQYFSNFFVNECRKNENSFPSAKLEAESLIYNFDPLYVGLKGSSYEQIYVFTKDDEDRVLLM